MANKQKGEVALNALGRDLTLKFSTNALCELEDLTDRSAIEIFQSMENGNVKISTMRNIIYAGLMHNKGLFDKIDNGLSDAEYEIRLIRILSKVGKIIDEVGFSNIAEKVGEAVSLAFPDAEDGEKPEEGKIKQAS
ncbi:MAG: hypothetical protein HRT61_10245 [Ekhidna sp.]|nr:hypothetical protein [Ekhidna sp.]